MVSTLLDLQFTAKLIGCIGKKIEGLCRNGAVLMEQNIWASTRDEFKPEMEVRSRTGLLDILASSRWVR